MNDARPVRRVEPLGKADEERQTIRARERPGMHHVGERLAVDEFGREIGPLDAGVGGEDVVADDRVVEQSVEDSGLLAEEVDRC